MSAQESDQLIQRSGVNMKKIVSMIMVSFSLCFLGIILKTTAHAETMEMNAEDLQVAKVARERLFPGGQDEEDLEVQAQIIKPVRKLDTAKEKSESSPSSTNDDEF